VRDMPAPLTRRTFLAGALGVGASAAWLTAASHDSMKSNYPKVVHHVFFWLKNPQSKEDLQKLLTGIKTLEAIPTVRGAHIGVPASTEQRAVVDSSFSASELLFFDDIAGQDAYQVHPIHKQFVESYSHLWGKVVVFDAVSV
jgi:Stress responsive A/B Barrel Domain